MIFSSEDLPGTVKAEHADLGARKERKADVAQDGPLGRDHLGNAVHRVDVLGHAVSSVGGGKRRFLGLYRRGSGEWAAGARRGAVCGAVLGLPAVAASPSSSTSAAPSVAVVVSERLARYGFGDGHPFGPDRLAAFVREFGARGLDRRVRVLEPRTATDAELRAFHTAEYLELVRERSVSGTGFLDAGDTPAFRGVYEAAAVVVGATLSALEAIMHEECRRAFVPIAGLHHAARDRAAGFCVFNDCGVVIELLQARGTQAHRLRRHRRAPRRRRVLRLRGRPGGDIRRPARGWPLPVSGHGHGGGDRQGRRARHEAQCAAAAGRGRYACSRRTGRKVHRAPGEVRPGVRAPAVRRRQPRGRSDHAPAPEPARPTGAPRASWPHWPSAAATGACWRWAAAATTARTSPRPGMPWWKTCCKEPARLGARRPLMAAALSRNYRPADA